MAAGSLEETLLVLEAKTYILFLFGLRVLKAVKHLTAPNPHPEV